MCCEFLTFIKITVVLSRNVSKCLNRTVHVDNYN